VTPAEAELSRLGVSWSLPTLGETLRHVRQRCFADACDTELVNLTL